MLTNILTYKIPLVWVVLNFNCTSRRLIRDGLSLSLSIDISKTSTEDGQPLGFSTTHVLAGCFMMACYFNDDWPNTFQIGGWSPHRFFGPIHYPEPNKNYRLTVGFWDPDAKSSSKMASCEKKNDWLQTGWTRFTQLGQNLWVNLGKGNHGSRAARFSWNVAF